MNRPSKFMVAMVCVLVPTAAGKEALQGSNHTPVNGLANMSKITNALDSCSSYLHWPNVDGSVTCGSSCTALVLTAPYGGRCDQYCASFGHVCTGAYEEVNENCRVKYSGSCDVPFLGTSDMLCRCNYVSGSRPSAPTPAPTPAPYCKPLHLWPSMKRSCAGCTALVQAYPYGGLCGQYCQSFDQVCTGAAEEVNNDCRVQYTSRCWEPILGTSDMLCTCQYYQP